MWATGFLRRLLSILALVVPLLMIAPYVGAAGVKAVDGQLMPDFRWQDEGGSLHRLSDSQGKPRLLHFWAAWCIPCREEMPQMLEWKHANPDIEIIPLSMDQRMAQAKYFINRFDLPMPPLLVNREDHDALSIPGLPYTLLITGEGKLVGRVIGIADWEDDAFSVQVRQRLGL